MKKSILITTAGRSSTHWVKNILSKLLDLNSKTFPKYNKEPFSIHCDFILDVEKDGGGNIYGGHIPLEYLFPVVDIVDIVVIVRDPRDVCVSAAYYMENKGLGTFDFFLKKYLKRGGSNPLFNKSYIHHRDEIPHVFIKYEDMVKDDFSTMSSLLRDLKYEYKEDELKKVLKKQSFLNLSGGRLPGEEDKKAFYRKGIIGDWKNYLNEAQNEEFCEKHKEVMNAFGYIKGD